MYKRQPLYQLVRVEAQGRTLRARGQRRDRQVDPEGGEHEDVAHRGAAGVAHTYSNKTKQYKTKAQKKMTNVQKVLVKT